MDEEIRILKEKMNNVQTTTITGCDFHQGELNTKKVILTKSGIGKVAAAVATTLLLEKFKPDVIINTGSAGGYDTSLNIGDVVISNEVRFHDVDVTAFGYEFGQMAELPAAFYADKKLIDIAQTAAQSFTSLKTTLGLICTGDIFMVDPEKVEVARKNFPTMMACEMEAAAVAQVCYQFGTPFVIIRSLSDIAGKKSDVSFEQYLPVAAKNAAELVESIVSKLD